MAYNLRSRQFQQSLLNENDAGKHFGGDVSENEEDNCEEESEFSDESTDSDDMETEDATADERILASRARGRPTTILRGKNGYVWKTQEVRRQSDRLSEPERVRIPQPKGAALNCNEFVEFWELLVNKEIIQKILDCTNKKIDEACLQMSAANEKVQTYHHRTDTEELNAFLGILYYAGLWKSHNVHLEELWSKRNGISFYRCIMPRARFVFLSTCLRFDNKDNRQVQDKLSPIREIWEIFIKNCSEYYKPHNFCTVDEQLLGFRGRCGFRMYIKSKPDKYGLKIITLNDARTSYLINAIPYLGKTKTSSNEPISEYFFRKVTTPIHGTNRSVTCDNWFTSIPLLERMLQPPYSMKITGTIRKNKREIPAEMKVASKEPPSTKFCFSKELLLLSHTPKKNKIVLLTSSYLRTTEITDGKPEVILHYNSTKGGTDCFDQLCHSYTTTRATQRWPLRFFFGILDQAAVNARILHKCHCINRNEEGKALTAKQCLYKLTFHLTAPYLRTRLQVPTLRRDIRQGITAILQYEGSTPSEERQYLAKRVRCRLCTPQEDRKTKEQCSSCQRPMCDQHRTFMCVDCTGAD